MRASRRPFAYFVRHGCLDEYVSARPRTEKYPMKRMDAIRLIAESLSGEEYVVATTGKPSRELFAVKDRARNFYMQGSMGHAAAIGLGIAREQAGKKVVVLDGDGALLMHLGILSSIGHYAPENLLHIVLDNESYETTGDQDTTSGTTDFCAMAKAAGYRAALELSAPADLQARFREFLGKPGPSLLRVKINRLPTPNIPRITSRHTSTAIADAFQREFTR
jgi:phosphonopyruvate decarboxylase